MTNGSENAENIIWVVVNRLDLIVEEHSTEHLDTNSCVKQVSIDRRANGACIKELLRKQFNINANNVSMKLRNTNSSLIPINSKIPANSKDMPYTLEVTIFRQNIKPSAVCLLHNQRNKEEQLMNLSVRIQKLESAFPEMISKKGELVNTDIQHLEQKLNFLNQRFKLAEGKKWKGMFTKHPMW